MKTSLFDMTFTLPPMVEMTEVMKDMPTGTGRTNTYSCFAAYCEKKGIRETFCR